LHLVRALVGGIGGEEVDHQHGRWWRVRQFIGTYGAPA